MNYPNTTTVDHVDTYFGTRISDPYRWLEDDRSPETADWVGRQNSFTQDYLSRIPYRQALRDRLTELWNYEKVGIVFEVGDQQYHFRNDGLQNQPVLYRQPLDGSSAAEVFIDPNTFSDDGTTSLAGLQFSETGTRCAYLRSVGGADWCSLHIIDTATGNEVEPPLQDIKFSMISWIDDDSFYYSTYDRPEGSKLSAQTDQHKVYRHHLGTQQSQDELLYGRDDSEKSRYVSAKATDNGYLALSLAQSGALNRVCITPIDGEPDFRFLSTADHQSLSYLIAGEGERFILYTTYKAPNGRIVEARLPDIDADSWVDLVPENKHPINMRQLVKSGKYLFIGYQNGPLSQYRQFDFNGRLIRNIEPPQPGQVTCHSGRKGSGSLYYAFTSYLHPSTAYRMELESGETSLFFAPPVKFDPGKYISTEIRYPSKDGTLIPMIVTHRRDLQLDGGNPTMLSGYGGFNICRNPAFAPFVLSWIEQGGVFVVANLRGGGEFGKPWHDAGRQFNKQNVFDDFIAAAEYLIGKGYTRSQRLGIWGGSNGGLLVGACMNQRPDLFGVAIPAVGVLDMLRYHRFTAGAGWAYDYGTSEESEKMFSYIRDYSPLHNVSQGTRYPSVMVTTGDHDDRVVPAHSFKFAAELQAKASPDSPQLIRIKVNAGHGAGQSTESMIAEKSDCWAFALWEMGVTELG